MSENISGSLLQRLIVEAIREHNVLPLTGSCNLSCIFCSHRFNPSGTKASSFNHLPLNSIQRLLQYLDPQKKIIIGESATRLREGEPLTHPHFFTIVKKLRQLYPQTIIQITTNGSLLTEEMIAKLAFLQPLEIIVSINSISVAGRKKLMADQDPLTALASLELLERFKIKFHGSVVALPQIVGFDDLENTLIALDQAGSRTIRLLLPGFTRLAPAELIPSTGTTNIIYNTAEKLQQRLSAPLLIEPPVITDLKPVISGVISGSPADQAGLVVGDLIKAVNNKKPFSRVEAFRLLTEKDNPKLDLYRKGRSFSTLILKEKDVSPGITVAYDLDPDQVDRVQKRIDPEGKTLMLLSVPALQRWQIALQTSMIDNLDLLTVPSLWFGGTICCAGLLVVSDYRSALGSFSALASYSSILLPSASFDLSGYDLCGEHYLSLSAGGLPICLV